MCHRSISEQTPATWNLFVSHNKETTTAFLSSKSFIITRKPAFVQFLSSELPCEPKSLDVALNTADVDRIRSENVRLRPTLKAIRFEF